MSRKQARQLLNICKQQVLHQIARENKELADEIREQNGKTIFELIINSINKACVGFGRDVAINRASSFTAVTFGMNAELGAPKNSYVIAVFCHTDDEEFCKRLYRKIDAIIELEYSIRYPESESRIVNIDDPVPLIS